MQAIKNGDRGQRNRKRRLEHGREAGHARQEDDVAEFRNRREERVHDLRAHCRKPRLRGRLLEQGLMGRLLRESTDRAHALKRVQHARGHLLGDVGADAAEASRRPSQKVDADQQDPRPPRGQGRQRPGQEEQGRRHRQYNRSTDQNSAHRAIGVGHRPGLGGQDVQHLALLKAADVAVLDLEEPLMERVADILAQTVLN